MATESSVSGSGITIASAPQKYQSSLRTGDSKGNGNGNVDSELEAEEALAEYCDDESKDECKEYSIYLVQSGYAMRHLKIHDISPKFSIGYGLNFAFFMNPFGGLSAKEDRYVPPHPDDAAQKGSFTNPIKLKNDYTVFSPVFYLDSRFRLARNLQFRERFSIAPFPETGELMGENARSEGSYVYPPINRQQYASGEKVFTYVSVGKIFSDELALRVWTMDGWNREVDGGVDVGLSLTAVEYIYGWDRYAKTQISDTKYHFYPGLTASFNMSFLYKGGKIAWVSKFIDVQASIGFTGGAPIASISFSGLIPIVFGNEIHFK